MKSVANPSSDEAARKRMVRFRKGLEAASKYNYLNHASCGPLHNSVRRATARFIREQSLEASLADPGWIQFMARARLSAAELIGAQMNEVCLMPNTSTGLIRALSSIPLHEGDEVVCLHDEFPALYFALQGARHKGAVLREVRSRPEDDLTEAVLSAITDRTRIVGVSWVGFLLGKRLDLWRLSEEKRRRGFYLIVDGIQGVGAVPLDVSELSLDFLSVGTQKWLLSPLGSGFLYASPEMVENHFPDWPGWYGIDVDVNEYTRRDVHARNSAVRFETGTAPLPSMYGMKRSLDEFNVIGVPAIWCRIQELTALLLDGLKELPVSILTPAAADERAGIVTFAVGKPRKLMDTLAGERIVVSLRDGLIRVSPHFWNTDEEIRHLLHVLGRLKR